MRGTAIVLLVVALTTGGYSARNSTLVRSSSYPDSIRFVQSIGSTSSSSTGIRLDPNTEIQHLPTETPTPAPTATPTAVPTRSVTSGVLSPRSYPSRSSESEVVRGFVRETFPEDPDTAIRIAICESNLGDHPDTYVLSEPDGGPMQINRTTWERFFAANYGWSWEQVVTDLDIHFRAARIIYDRAGGFGPWNCY